MVDFSSLPQAAGYFAPARFDAELLDCEVIGKIPEGLEGAFYRLHADWLYPPKFRDEASLSADGYISMFRFKDGIVDYRGRYVRTDRFTRQIAARRQLYGYYRNPYTDDPEVRNVADPGERTTANTTPVILAGKLYATKEDGLPYELDPNTLQTRRQEDFGGQWRSQTFTAHPKLDPVTGELIAFGYEASGPASRDVFLATFDRTGAIKSSMRFEVPHTTMLHDIAITDRYVILPGSSAVTSRERIEQGKIHWGWDRSAPSYYGIIPRDGDPRSIRWFRGPERSIVHTANAWSEGSRLFVDLPMADGNTWPFFPDIHGGPFQLHPNTLRRLTFDLETPGDACVEEPLFSQEITSFTRIDDRCLGHRHRYIYVQIADPDQPFHGSLPDDPRAQPNNTLARFDLERGTMAQFFAGESHIVQEPCFVPRAGGTAEGDGYLLATVHNLAAMRAELVIVSAMSMAELARVVLPFRNASQVHGAWATEQDLPLT
ncbi:MAG: carotenoid oxygenase family protein [Steroidobacteraceae bacterium]